VTRRYLFDTNAVRPLYDARGPQTALRPSIEALVLEDGGLTIAAVVEYEIRRGLETRALDPARQPPRRLLGAADRLLTSANVLGLDWEHWRTASLLYAQSRSAGSTLQERDLLVAATAFASARKLVTVDRPLAEGLQALGYSDRVVLLSA